MQERAPKPFQSSVPEPLRSTPIRNSLAQKLGRKHAQHIKGGSESMKHNTIQKIAGVTAAAALTMLPALTLADAAQSALVVGGNLNLRETASLDAKVLGQYPTGTLVEIVKAGDVWHQVSVNGKEGYMMAKFLSDTNSTVTATVKTNTGIGLNLREEPSLHGAILTSAKNGSTVTVLQKGDTWCRVKVGDQEGFMASKFLRFAAASTVTTPASGKVAVVNNPKATQVLNLRETASLDARVLAYYRNGTKVTILKSGTTWHKVQVEDGRMGYMMAKYLKLTDDTAAVQPFAAKTMNVNGGRIVNLRKSGSLNAAIIATVPVNTEVTVLEHGTDWCRVKVGEAEGYMSTWFLKW